MFFRQVYDERLAQYAYLIGCQRTGEMLVVDPERDIDRYLDIAAAEGMRVTAVAETHIHADFLSGARELAFRVGARLHLTDEGDEDWKYEWARRGHYDVQFLRDGDRFQIGEVELEAMHTPGHTPEHMAFLVTDRGGGADGPMGILSGDFVFAGDVGRPDLLETAVGARGTMEPAARLLHGSLRRFLELPDHLQVWPAHGAGSVCGKALGAVPQTTVGYERRFNPALDYARRGEGPFVDFILEGQPEPPLYFARMKRDNKLGVRILGGLPNPRELGHEALTALANDRTRVLLDTRPGPSTFMEQHVPGSIHVPLNGRFITAVGSLVAEGSEIVLVADEADIPEAVRSLVRIGYDRVSGFVTPSELDRHVARGGASARIEEIDFHRLEELTRTGRGRPLDVRYGAEYGQGHVPGSLGISYTRLPEHLDGLAGDRPLLVYCATGGRAAIAASFLAREGLDVMYVNDGWASYVSDHEVAQGESLAA